jgi:hypothetical protein
MSDVLQISRRRKTQAPEAPPKVQLPFTVELPSRYYGRAAVAETAAAFSAIATVETKPGDGVLALTFTTIDEEAGDVIAEFLNHALYGSATASEEASA